MLRVKRRVSHVLGRCSANDLHCSSVDVVIRIYVCVAAQLWRPLKPVERLETKERPWEPLQGYLEEATESYRHCYKSHCQWRGALGKTSKNHQELAVTVHACNLGTQEAKAGESGAQGQPGTRSYLKVC